jgi:hypothetical protein
VTANGSVAAAEAPLLDGPDRRRGLLDSHSTMYPGGEIRGFPDLALFVDGFESGDVSAWTTAVP